MIKSNFVYNNIRLSNVWISKINRKLKNLFMPRVFFVKWFALLLVLFGLFSIDFVLANQSATMYLTSPQSSYYLDEVFSVSVKINPNQQMVQLGRVILSYPVDKLEYISFQPSSSFPYLSPGSSNDQINGIINVGAFQLGPGSNSQTELGILTFRGKSLGQATLNWQNGTHIISPDQEELINLSACTGLTLNIIPLNNEEEEVPQDIEPEITDPVITPDEDNGDSEDNNQNINNNNSDKAVGTRLAPQIYSKTHPIPGNWYNNGDIELNWEVSQTTNGFSYNLNKESQFVVDNYSEGSNKTIDYTNREDAMWYFHIAGLYAGGKSSTVHYALFVDTTAPEKFTPSLDANLQAQEIVFDLVFATQDNLSGIDYYEVSFDENEFKKISSPYRLGLEEEVSEIIVVKAYDKAGNEQLGKLEITEFVRKFRHAQPYRPTILVEPPIIEKAGEKVERKTFLYTEELLLFSGKAMPLTHVTLYIEQADIILQTQVDKDGNWWVYLEQDLPAGNYTVYGITEIYKDDPDAPVGYVFASNEESVISDPSEKVPFAVAGLYSASKNKNKLFGIWWFWWLLLLLLLLLLWIRHEHRKHQKRKLREQRNRK